MMSPFLKVLDKDFFDLLQRKNPAKFPLLDIGKIERDIEQALHFSSVTLYASDPRWERAEDMQDALQQKWIQIESFTDGAHLRIPPSDLKKITVKMITGQIQTDKMFHPSLLDASLTFLAQQAVMILQKQPDYRDLSMALSPQKHELKGLYYTSDLRLETEDGAIFFQISIKKECFERLEQRFQSPSYFIKNLRQDQMLPLSLQLGHVTIEHSTPLQEGDFLLLDRVHYSLKKDRGFFKLRLSKTDLYEIQYKEGSWKVADAIMNFKEIPMDEDFDEDSFEENKFSEENFDEDSEESDFSEEKFPSEELAESPLQEMQTEHKIPQSSLRKVPIKIDVEVGRFEMSLEKIESLKTGDILPLSFDPAKVQLVVNDRMIGRGEFVEVGDIIGVRITELFETKTSG